MGATAHETVISPPNTTTLTLFKKNSKAHITGLELGVETTSFFTEIQKHLKRLDFHF